MAGSVKPSASRATDSQPTHETKLSPATAHRLDQQIKRAFRHTYGAEAGLRTLVRLAATEMLRAGASRDVVRKALIERVDDHPGRGKPSLLTGESQSAALTRLMLGWCDEICARAVKESGAG
jgi:hypothetical protein